MQLNQTNVLEASCNTLNDLSKKVCVPNKTEELNIHVFNMITGKNVSKHLTNHANINVDLMEENVIQIKSGITINFNVSGKIIIYVKNIIFEILVHAIVKIENI